VIQKHIPDLNYSTISANDCADEEHHRIMQAIMDKADDVNRKQKRIKEIVRQRRREDADELSHQKRQDMQQFLLTTNQFMAGWDRRILEETNQALEADITCEHPLKDGNVPKHFVHKHNNEHDIE